jgi:hypothetical protein
MKLKFYARGDGLVSLPDERRVVGLPARYVNRRQEGRAFPATEDAHEVDSSHANARRLVKRCQRDELWAADQATAEFCGVAYTPLEFKDGSWQPRPKAPSTRNRTAE